MSEQRWVCLDINPSEVRKKNSRGVDMAKYSCHSAESEVCKSHGGEEEAVL